ncbi:uncharacterized protein PHALS_08999 [Plasmopara halstedii]|uniref:Uncharacterized protein n=1 Tax=Plasmopara halstedii TaxID=4781 RepID=A0A0P1AER2_PLAHL|nr:uncharacterized protein PHALS_08999 [Plasmopara halstedii]CEG38956.1 hypothetical protein PHALS_08999 [Plasmopara halstedii]|eukprot:XP_024575325.1 hypothetical protein PHALS_08999 [Plasmopara halstedii]
MSKKRDTATEQQRGIKTICNYERQIQHTEMYGRNKLLHIQYPGENENISCTF